MITAKGYAAQSKDANLTPFSFERRALEKKDVLIEISHCGVCHSDVHQARNEWGFSLYPMVPGHEIVGKITAIGAEVTKFKVGDFVGVGCFVDSCRNCPECSKGIEQYCDGRVGTYSSKDKNNLTTQGGYSNCIVVDEQYTVKIPKALDHNLAGVAPLLCAGITTYSPLRYVNIKPGDKVAVAGLGGLGHMAVKFAVAFGAEVTVLSRSENKKEDAKKLGAHHFALINTQEELKKVNNSFDIIVNTIGSKHNYQLYLDMLKTNGKMIVLGLPEEPQTLHPFSIVPKRKSIIGSMIGGIAETQEMLNYCAEKNIFADVEVIPIQQINEAFERMLKSDVKYRFVIGMDSLN
ncbi:MAG: NAD(P)-dependent alcohol dehydrogenase [Bacteroidota bacterium]